LRVSILMSLAGVAAIAIMLRRYYASSAGTILAAAAEPSTGIR
jgi:hypothetical protein